MTHVPFAGNAPALTEVMAGRVTFMFYPIIGIAEHVAQKRSRRSPSAPTSAIRTFPNVPTMAERASRLRGDSAVGRHAGAGRHARGDRANAQRRDAQSLAKPERRSG